jgi:hypothetical protein
VEQALDGRVMAKRWDFHRRCATHSLASGAAYLTSVGKLDSIIALLWLRRICRRAKESSDKSVRRASWSAAVETLRLCSSRAVQNGDPRPQASAGRNRGRSDAYKNKSHKLKIVIHIFDCCSQHRYGVCGLPLDAYFCDARREHEMNEPGRSDHSTQPRDGFPHTPG